MGTPGNAPSMLVTALLGCAMLLSEVLIAQADSSGTLPIQKMRTEHIIQRDPVAERTIVRSATRSAENPDDLPFTVFVVTEEEILARGLATLGDVLKIVPGIRVSQPGNALEGETFMVRGLAGNQYMRVLINDIPVKPFGAPGMPIGAQLPIRQASRIEIYFGPSSAVWGSEACAGIVNIILKETERPIFTRADLTFGSLGHFGLDVGFGGKLGRDNRIFRYSIYGSSTVRERTDIFYDKALYNPDLYRSANDDPSLYLDNPNYNPVFPSDGAPPSPIGHESRLFGFGFKWRGINASYNAMARFDHMALGMNPSAISYSNPSNRIGERIETFSLGFQRERKTWHTHYTFSAVRYRIDEASTSTLVHDRLGAALFYTQKMLISPSQWPSLQQNIISELSSGQRHSLANGIDGRMEIRFQKAVWKEAFFQFGGQGNLSITYPLIGYQPRPVQLQLLGDTPSDGIRPFPPAAYRPSDINTFAQLEWRGRKIFFVGGAAVNLRENVQPIISPRIGVTWRLDSTWIAYTNASTGFRNPTPFELVQRYRLTDGTVRPTLWTDGGSLQPEWIQTIEAGIRFRQNWLESSLSGFIQQGNNLFRNGYLFRPQNASDTWFYGFAQAPGKSLQNWGIQHLISSKGRFNVWTSKRKQTTADLRMDLNMQYTEGKEWFGYGIPFINNVRNMPGWTTQWSMTAKADKFQLTLFRLGNRNITSKSVFYNDTFQQKRPGDISRFHTWDAALRLFLSDQFSAYLQIHNALNKRYAGIDAYGTPDDLLYNPQQRRIVRLGVSYNMSDRSKGN